MCIIPLGSDTNGGGTEGHIEKLAKTHKKKSGNGCVWKCEGYIFFKQKITKESAIY